MYHHPLCPPLVSGPYQDVLQVHVDEIQRLVQQFAEVVVLLYDIVDEPSRRDPTTVLTPRPRHDTVTYLLDLRRTLPAAVQVVWCLFRAIRPDDTLDTLLEWYSHHHDLFDRLVVTGNHWNPLKLERVYPALRALGLPPKPFGAVLLPHRLGEKERCVARQACGVDFFVTQLQLYPTPEWQAFVELLGPCLVTLTTAPASQKQLDFLATLGVQTQGYEGIDDPFATKVQRAIRFVSPLANFGFEILPELKKGRVALLEILSS